MAAPQNRRPTDQCRYCGHTRAQHNRPVDLDRLVRWLLRCGVDECVCAGFAEPYGYYVTEREADK